MEKKEMLRQFIHIAAGIFFIAILIYLGRVNLIAVSLVLLIFGSLLINFKIMGKHVPVAHDLGGVLERENVRFPGWGPAWYLVGILLLSSVLADTNEITAGIFILGVSDGLATITGIRGKHKLPYNKKKTVEGTIVFLATSLAAYFLVGPKILPLAIIATVIESFDLPIDDNFSLPLVCAVYLYLF